MSKNERVTHTAWMFFHQIRLRATAIMLVQHNDPRAIAWGHVLECDLNLRLGRPPPNDALGAARHAAIKQALEEARSETGAAS